MKHRTFGWHSSDGLTIAGQSWQPNQPAGAIVCLVHGWGEHSSRYNHVAEAFCQHGIGLMTFDLPGHGKSGGKRGAAPGYKALLAQIDTLLSRADQIYPGLPCFLYGHSFGGNLTLNYVLRHTPRLAGVIVTSPWLRLMVSPGAMQRKFLAAANRLWPDLTLATKLDTTAISRDPASVHAYQTDPLNHDRLSVRMFFEINKAGEWALAHAAAFPLPLLLMHGGADRITSAGASRQFADRAPDCTFKLWDGLFHEPHNEPEQAEVLAVMVNWLDKRRGQ
jgi:alpha-beta hydrolase superfamily lysophospholipase